VLTNQKFSIIIIDSTINLFKWAGLSHTNIKLWASKVTLVLKVASAIIPIINYLILAMFGFLIYFQISKFVIIINLWLYNLRF
jgi:uncharacterized membrane protein YcfT